MLYCIILFKKKVAIGLPVLIPGTCTVDLDTNWMAPSTCGQV